MTELVHQVLSVWQDAAGQMAEVVLDGGEGDAVAAFKVLDSLKEPLRQTETCLVLEGGRRVALPFVGSAFLLPDRTGVAAIFSPGQYVNAHGQDFFPRPGNAAVFNADGSLRFQLKLDRGDRIAAFHGGEMPDAFKGCLGVVVAPDASAPPDRLYALDPDTPTLTATGQLIRW